jgi:hypothetical protein
MAELRRLLDANGIDYGTAPAASGVRAYDYTTGRTGKRTVSQGDLLIDARQPHGGILQVLMDPDPVLSDSMTYDITAWALPHALGLDALALTSPLSVAGEWVQPARAQRATGPEQAYAWVLPGNGADAIRGLASLLRDGVTVRRADTGFAVDGQVFAAGDFVITRRNNEGVADMDRALARASKTAGTRAMAVTSGRVTSGYDFGSSHYDAIQAPRVATIVGPGASSLSAGEIWHHFETKLDYPLSRVGALDELDLDNLDVVILPSGWYRMGEEERSALADWVRGGGQLVAVGGACSALPVRMAGDSSAMLKESGPRLRPPRRRSRRRPTSAMPTIGPPRDWIRCRSRTAAGTGSATICPGPSSRRRWMTATRWRMDTAPNT